MGNRLSDIRRAAAFHENLFFFHLWMQDLLTLHSFMIGAAEKKMGVCIMKKNRETKYDFEEFSEQLCQAREADKTIERFHFCKIYPSVNHLSQKKSVWTSLERSTTCLEGSIWTYCSND